MNLLCPQCQQTIAIADQYAGQLMKCPLCAGTFTAPSLAAATAPLGFASAPSLETPRSQAGAPPSIASAETSSTAPKLQAVVPSPADDYVRTATIWISPRVIPWIGPVALVLILALTFFTWLEVYDQPSSDISTRNAWGLGFGHPINALSLFYLLFLLVGVIVAVEALVLPRTTLRVPDALRQILPWSSGIMLVIVTMGFVFLVLQLLTKFKQEAAETALPIYTMRTYALRTCILIHAIAVVSYALEFWLVIRKTKSMPRIDVRW